MNGINKCRFLGNVTQDVTVRETSAGKVANFSLAINEEFKKKDGTKSKSTEYINLVVWPPYSDIVEKYLSKGSLVLIEDSKAQTRSYEDKSGQKKYITEYVVRELRLLSGREKPQQSESNEEETDLLPF